MNDGSWTGAEPRRPTRRAGAAAALAAAAGGVLLGASAATMHEAQAASAARPLVLVAGATGRTGGEVVLQLVHRGSFRVRALVRDPARAELPAGVELVVGDLRDPASLARAVQGATFVISAAGSTRDFHGDNRPELVDYEGTRNLAAAARAANVQRFCLVSSMGVTQPDHPLNRLNRVLEWKLKGEEALRASGVPYTIVRPGGLTDAPGGRQGVRVGQGDQWSSGQVPRADVASACVESLTLRSAANVTFELLGVPDTPPPDWARVYAGLLSDAVRAE